MAKSNYLHLVQELLHGVWLVRDPQSHAGLVVDLLTGRGEPATNQSSSEPTLEVFSMSGGATSRGDGKSSQGKVIVVPIHETITKYETCASYGGVRIANEMLSRNDGSVCGFVLDIDSGGGSLGGVIPLVKAISEIRSQGKPVLAHVDNCYSAAYWIASQCDAIFCDNAFSGVGSIGAFAVLTDNRVNKATGERRIEIYAPQSRQKNLAYREALEGNTARIEADLSRTVDAFIDAVKKGRPSLDLSDASIFEGAEFRPPEAVKAGLVDGMATLEETVTNVFVRCN